MTGPRVGALDWPTPLPAPGMPGGDPALETLLSFIAAVLRSPDIAPAWAAMPTKAQHTDVVGSVSAFQLEAHDFNENLLPALHGWREGGETVQLAADYRMERSTLIVEWIALPSVQDPDRRRPAFLNAVGKRVVSAIKGERHPAWVVPGDTDPQAAKAGSLLWSFMGTWSESVKWARGTFGLDRDDSKRGADANYQTVRWSVEVLERDEPAPGDLLGGLSATLTQGGDGLTIAFDGEPE